MDRPTETEIAEGLRQGKREAWVTLYDLYAEKVWGHVAQLMGGDSASVADIVQETFLAARSAGSFNPRRGSPEDTKKDNSTLAEPPRTQEAIPGLSFPPHLPSTRSGGKRESIRATRAEPRATNRAATDAHRCTRISFLSFPRKRESIRATRAEPRATTLPPLLPTPRPCDSA